MQARRGAIAGLAVATLALGLVACGGGSSGGSGGSTTSTESSAQRAAAREKRLEAQVHHLIPIARTSQMGKTRKQQFRIADAESKLEQVAGKSLRAVRPLLRGLERRDYKLIADLPGFYVALGKPGSEPALAAAVGQLYPTGDPRYTSLPFDFIGTGNAKLDRLVTDELKRHGYSVSGQPNNLLRWGSSGAYGGGAP